VNATSSVNVLLEKNITDIDKLAEQSFFNEDTEFLLEEYDNKLSPEDDFKETSDETLQFEGVKV